MRLPEPPGTGFVPSGIGRRPELFEPLRNSRRLPRVPGYQRQQESGCRNSPSRRRYPTPVSGTASPPPDALSPRETRPSDSKDQDRGPSEARSHPR